MRFRIKGVIRQGVGCPFDKMKRHEENFSGNADRLPSPGQSPHPSCWQTRHPAAVFDPQDSGINRVDFDKGPRLLPVEQMRPPGHGAGMPVEIGAPGCQGKRVLRIRQLCRLAGS